MNPLLELYKGLVEKLADSGSSNAQFSMPQLAPQPAPDAATMLQNTVSQAGLDNESVNYLRPGMPMPHVDIPQLPMRQVQQPPQMTERERYLQSEMQRIQEGRPPPALLQ